MQTLLNHTVKYKCQQNNHLLNKLINSSNYNLYKHCCCWRFGNHCCLQNVRAYTRNTSKSAAREQNKSAVTDHAISLNHVIDWDRAKVINRESNRMNRWIREAIHIRKEQDKSMNRVEESYQLPHIYDYLLSATATPGGQSFWWRQQRLLKRQQQQCI